MLLQTLVLYFLLRKLLLHVHLRLLVLIDLTLQLYYVLLLKETLLLYLIQLALQLNVVSGLLHPSQPLYFILQQLCLLTGLVE